VRTALHTDFGPSPRLIWFRFVWSKNPLGRYCHSPAQRGIFGDHDNGRNRFRMIIADMALGIVACDAISISFCGGSKTEAGRAPAGDLPIGHNNSPTRARQNTAAGRSPQPPPRHPRVGMPPLCRKVAHGQPPAQQHESDAHQGHLGRPGKKVIGLVARISSGTGPGRGPCSWLLAPFVTRLPGLGPACRSPGDFLGDRPAMIDRPTPFLVSGIEVEEQLAGPDCCHFRGAHRDETRRVRLKQLLENRGKRHQMDESFATTGGPAPLRSHGQSATRQEEIEDGPSPSASGAKLALAER